MKTVKQDCSSALGEQGRLTRLELPASSVLLCDAPTAGGQPQLGQHPEGLPSEAVV